MALGPPPRDMLTACVTAQEEAIQPIGSRSPSALPIGTRIDEASKKAVEMAPVNDKPRNCGGSLSAQVLWIVRRDCGQEGLRQRSAYKDCHGRRPSDFLSDLRIQFQRCTMRVIFDILGGRR